MSSPFKASSFREVGRSEMLGVSGVSGCGGLRGKLDDRCGQSTIEAAFVLPILMLLILMMLQPAICLYDHIVMRSAAAEGCRLLATSPSDTSTNEDYIRRRLSAIPDIPIFHEHSGGCSYEIEMVGDETSSEVSVMISNRVRPLPLLDLAMRLANALDEGGDIVIETKVGMSTQPEWAESSSGGSSPREWVNKL